MYIWRAVTAEADPDKTSDRAEMFGYLRNVKRYPLFKSIPLPVHRIFAISHPAQLKLIKEEMSPNHRKHLLIYQVLVQSKTFSQSDHSPSCPGSSNHNE